MKMYIYRTWNQILNEWEKFEIESICPQCESIWKTPRKKSIVPLWHNSPRFQSHKKEKWSFCDDRNFHFWDRTKISKTRMCKTKKTHQPENGIKKNPVERLQIGITAEVIGRKWKWRNKQPQSTRNIAYVCKWGRCVSCLCNIVNMSFGFVRCNLP